MSTGQEASDLKYEANQVSQDDIDTLDMTLEKKRKQRRRRPSSLEKGEKGLRSFAVRVRKKVEEKKITTYNQVADELVNEVLDPEVRDPTDRFYNEKNIRRRVYDALNVLMAMGMIEKQKKDILWRGVSFDSSDFLKELEEKVRNKNEELRQKRQRLEELEAQKRAVEAMLARNASSSASELQPESCIHLPFIIVSTSADTSIDVEMEENAEEVLFTFNRPFEIYDDQVILQGIFRNTNVSNRRDEHENVSVSEKQAYSSNSRQSSEPSQHSCLRTSLLSRNTVDNSMFNSHLVYLTDDV
ncbi:hypothetical protein GAYE_SCF05G2673 [Galdieria yellowstonensis]|uniref:Transcription factor Dp-1 n=1 Tax=Galdieria yellowstonensis TaxID=3028027 RepID=A0AAV9IBE5_9RHOD|nr:hypothetical protein GAYE_SCF05G2673 [Galdieria yellowstonensis]